MDNNSIKSAYRSITVQQARQLMCSLSCYTVFLDVRREDEFRQGHIKGAVNIPLNQLEQKAPLLLLDLSQEIIVYCRTGSRSYEASETLLSLGYKNVFDMGGITGWCYELEK
ncbi:MAG: rhodanese-like domain-containing protein [Ruminococcaceae bacterium]|nr:rhodanese-like domain-containing protein [Oscillospiraceae bacterium]